MPPSFNIPKYGITSLPSIDPNTRKPASGADYYGKNMMPDWVKNQRESWHGVDYCYFDFHWKVELRNYCETLRSVDESIGAVLDCLKEAGLDENTLVIYMADNGCAWGEHGLVDKRQFYEESVRSMLVRCPGLIKGGTIIENLVQTIYIAPTIMEYAGLTKTNQMVGLSFLPLLKGLDIPWRKQIFYEYYWEYDYPETPTMFGVRTNRLQVHPILWSLGHKRILRLKEDSNEMHNLIGVQNFKTR